MNKGDRQDLMLDFAKNFKNVEFTGREVSIAEIKQVKLYASLDPEFEGCFEISFEPSWWGNADQFGFIWTDGEDFWKSLGKCILSMGDRQTILKAIEDYCKEIG